MKNKVGNMHVDIGLLKVKEFTKTIRVIKDFDGGRSCRNKHAGFVSWKFSV